MLLCSATLARSHILDEVADGIWYVYFGPVKLETFDERDIKGKSVPYLTIKF